MGVRGCTPFIYVLLYFDPLELPPEARTFYMVLFYRALYLYSWFHNDSTSYANTYGPLYNWFTVETGNLCPTGWHVPNHDEWTNLINYLGGYNAGGAGGKLKEAGTTHWNSPNEGATNETGFTALPGGSRGQDGIFLFIIGNDGYWWSSSEYSSTNALGHSLHHWESGAGAGFTSKKTGCSIRCVKD